MCTVHIKHTVYEVNDQQTNNRILIPNVFSVSSFSMHCALLDNASACVVFKLQKKT